jgi:hypothetical protein
MTEFERNYGDLARIIETSHRHEIQAKDRELAESREMTTQLAREVLNLKAELSRLKTQDASMSESSRNPASTPDKADDAQSFFFPPLRLTHVRVLKTAIKRRAEKIRQNIDDPLGRSRQGSVASVLPRKDLLAPAGLDETREKSTATQSPPATSSDAGDREKDYARLERELEFSRTVDRAARTEIDNLHAHVRRLRESVSYWTDRCEALDRDRQDAIESLESEHAVFKTRSSIQLRESWQQGWQARSEELKERMRKVEREAQATLESAIAERDQRLDEHRRMIEGLTVRLEMSDGDIKRLQQWIIGDQDASRLHEIWTG